MASSAAQQKFTFTKFPLGIEIQESENEYFEILRVTRQSEAWGKLRAGLELIALNGISLNKLPLKNLHEQLLELKKEKKLLTFTYRIPPDDVGGELFIPFEDNADDGSKETSIDQTAVMGKPNEHITTIRKTSALPAQYVYPISMNDIMSPNDLKKTIVNIDSRFRDYTRNGSDTNFSYFLDPQFKNVIRIKLVSIEFPNIFYTFAKYQGNIKFLITYSGNTAPVTIDEGNYKVPDLETMIQTKLNVASSLLSMPAPGLQISIDQLNGLVTLSAPVNFDIDFTPPVDTNYNYSGIGWNLGFRNRIYTGKSTYIGESVIDVYGEQYFLLRLNDFNNVEQRLADKTVITAFAKVLLKSTKFNVSYDDSSNFVTKEIIFAQPQNLSQLNVTCVDAYGTIIDNDGVHMSFALEITEVMNAKLYDFYRNYLLQQQRA